MQTLQYLKEGESELAKHNIISFHGHFYFRNHLCISFPLLGRTLYDASSHPMAVTVIAQIARQLSEALVFLKSRRIMHCDLKPDNVLFLSEDPQDIKICLIDFGTSCFAGGELYM